MDATALAKCDFDVICRLCLNRDGPLTCLFSHGPDEMPLNHIAQTCAAVDIDEEDGLPPNICCACRDTILFSYQFRQQVSRNDTILRCVAGMKKDLEDEEDVVTIVADEIPVIVHSGESETEDDGADSKDIDIENANHNEAVESLEEFNAHFLVGEGHRTVCKDTHSHIGVESSSENAGGRENEEISRRKQWFNQKSNWAKPVQNITTRYIDSVQARKSREIRTDTGRSHPSRTKTKNPKPVQISTVSSKIRAKIIEFGAPGGGGYYCKQCKGFYSKRKFISHIKRSHSKNFICDHCGRRFYAKSRLLLHIQNIHLENVHGEIFEHGTLALDTKPIQNSSFSREIRSKTIGRNTLSLDAKPVQSSTVSREIHSKPDSNRSHLMTTKTSNSKLVQNSTVSREISAKIIEYGNPYGDGYYCKQCKGFYSKCDFITHIKRLHLINRDFICEECGRSFFTKWFLSNHIQNFHLDENSAEILAKMKEYGTHAPDTDSYYCNLCQKLFLQRKLFFNHVKFKHLQIRNFMCDHCGYRTVAKCSLTEHIDGVHLRVKKHQCRHCPLRFCTKHELNRHTRTIHRPGGVRMVMCEVCGKYLSSEPELMRHMRAQHFPELKIKCDFCDCRYACRRKLQAHLKKMH